MWNGREWEKAGVTLNISRYRHVSWPRHDGLLLMGGRGSMKSTELVTWDGTNSTRKTNFTLKYPLK